MFPALFVWMRFFPNSMLGYLTYAGEFALIAAYGAWTKRWRTRMRATDVGLFVGDRLIASRASMRSAHVRTARDGTWLRIQRRLGTVDVAIDPADEEPLLHALRFDPAGVVARYTAAPDRRKDLVARWRFFAAIGVPLLSFLGAFIAAEALANPRVVLSSLIVAIVVQYVAAARSIEHVNVGAEGIRLRRFLGRVRYVSFASVEAIETEGTDIVLKMLGGKTVAWHRPRLAFKGAREQHQGMAVRIARGLEAHRSLAQNESARLARGARSIETWLRDLHAVSDPEQARYRVAAVPSEELWKSVENATASPTSRAGAAVALRRVLDDAARKRLHDIASTCASDKLRLAIEAAADDEDLVERLGALAD